MRVLITGPALSDPGGVANYYNAVLPFLRQEPGLTVDYLEIGSKHGTLGVFHPLADQVRLRKKLRTFDPTLVHVNPSLNLRSFVRDGAFIHQAKRRGDSVIVFFRGWSPDFAHGVNGRWRGFFRRTYRNADGYIVLASSFAETLRRWGVTAPIHRSSTAVADDLLQGFSLPRKLERVRTAREISVLFLGRLEEDKGVLETIAAVTRLLREGHDIRLTIAGEGGADEEVERRIGSDATLAGRIQKVGYLRHREKAAVLESHDVFCFPTRHGEGMPNAVLEAMAFGMPVITCPVAGLADFFEDRKMGCLLGRADAAHTEEALRRLVKDRESIVTMGSYNYEYASAHFLASAVSRQLVAVYEQTATRAAASA